jgi:hypothetical protein
MFGQGPLLDINGVSLLPFVGTRVGWRVAEWVVTEVEWL